MRMQKPEDKFEYERRLWLGGLKRVAGVDEAGRGPLAGPVVAAAVILPSAWMENGLPPELTGLNDSKQLTPSRRETFFNALLAHPKIEHGIAIVEAELIDELNIAVATARAMATAISRLRPPPEHVLVDGLHVASLKWPQTAIIKGDARSYSIAAASVLAKVTRDRLMMDYHKQWPQYGFDQHKGYGTARHLSALAEHGPCPIHRRSFAPIKPGRQQELF